MIDQEEINIGSVPNDGTGDTIRVSFHKTNNNFSEVYGAIANTENDVIDLENVIVTNTGLVRVNAVYTIVNTVFAVTNSSYVHANSSFDRANGATLNVTAAFGKANSIPINVAFTKANAAFDLASSAYDFANGVSTNTFVFSNLTNTVFGFANTINTFAYGVSTNTTAAFDKANSINLIPGFTKANSAYDLANGAYVYANTLVSESTNLIPVFTQANSAYDLANGAYIYANTINLVPYALSTDVANVNTFAYGVSTNATAAFDKANTALQNTTGTLNGTLTVNNTIVVKTLKGPYTDDTDASANGSVALKELYYDASGMVRIRLV